MLKFKVISILITSLYIYSCGKTKIKPAIGDKVSRPFDIVAAPDGDVHYILNSDLNQIHQTGSILILKSGVKVGHLEIPPLGRTMRVLDNYLLVGFDHKSGDVNSQLIMFDITNREKPKQVKEWALPYCSPIGITAVDNYKYFFTSCISGRIFLGELKSEDPKKTTVKPVREYFGPHRAAHIDTKAGLLYLFPTSLGHQVRDQVLRDNKDWDDEAVMVDKEGGNEFPDEFARSKSRWLNFKRTGGPYTLKVYDIKAEEKKGFPYVSLAEGADISHEITRMIYGNFQNIDGSPDIPAAAMGKKRYYHTNFWEVQRNPDNPDKSFYLSHRGDQLLSDTHANNILQVDIVGNARPTADKDGKLTAPKTAEYLRLKRVYGFRGENSANDYFGPFKLFTQNGRSAMVINSIRDLDNFEDPRHQITAITLDERVDLGHVQSMDKIRDAFYQVSVSSEGLIATCLLYENKVKIFKIVDNQLVEFKTVE